VPRQLFFLNRHQHVNRDGNPNLGLHPVVGGAVILKKVLGALSPSRVSVPFGARRIRRQPQPANQGIAAWGGLWLRFY